MRSVKYVECYLKYKNLFIPVEELRALHDQNIEEYQKNFYGDFYCPECFEAELAFYPNARTPHFKTKPSSVHNPDCSYNFNLASKKEIDSYCSDQNNHNAIARKLKSCLELLSKQMKLKPFTITGTDKAKKELANYYTLWQGDARKSIRRKKLSMPFDESKDYNIPMIFYGSVIAEWDLRNINVKNLRVKNLKTEKLICSITVSNNIYKYIDDGIKFDGRKNADIAFIAAMSKNKDFNNCAIRHSTEIMMSNISTQLK